MKLLLIFLLVINSLNAFSQANYEGHYTGTANGDQVILQLNKTAANKYSGKLSDSYQEFELSLEEKDGNITGTALEKKLAIGAKVNGNLKQQILNLNLQLDPPYNEKLIELILTKQNNSHVTSSNTNNNEVLTNKPKLPTGASQDPMLIGTWTKNENYQSGYGGDQLNASYSEQLIFFADGTLGDGGSKASMSGDNYYGQSQGKSVPLKDVYWYNVENQLYILSIQQGKSQAQHLGRYYIENGKMLITANNGNKTLLIKN